MNVKEAAAPRVWRVLPPFFSENQACTYEHIGEFSI
jgi:hypothetical protein